MTTVMGRTQSVIAEAIRDLCRQEHADDHDRVVLADGRIRVRLYREGQDAPVGVWFVFPDGQVRQEATA